jgi:hypothetical protein
MRPVLQGLALAACLLADAPVHAAVLDVKPGLWEYAITTESTAPPIDAKGIDTSGLDPAAKARVEEVLKKQAARRAAQGDGPRTSTRKHKSCLTQEKLDRRDFTDLRPGRGDAGTTCSSKMLESTAAKIHLRMECSGTSQGVVDVTYEAQGREAMTLAFLIDAKQEGHAYTSKGTGTARWIGADCGTVK